MSVYRQHRQYSADFEVRLSVLGNKVRGSDDVAFLRDAVGGDLLACFTQSAPVRALEQGRPFGIEDLEPENRSALAAVQAAVDATVRDWDRFVTQMHAIHVRNARAWANDATGVDLTDQIDPTFRYPTADTEAAVPPARTASADSQPVTALTA